jgi:predicted AAA+ superfamily ATPase
LAAQIPFQLRKWRCSVYFFSPHADFFLFGPRCTGKSTWLAHQFLQDLRLDLLAPEVLRAYQARPERLRQWIAAEPEAHTVVIDEIQKAPQLLDVVNALLEERPGLRFVLTGSRARKLRHGAANLLGGQAGQRLELQAGSGDRTDSLDLAGR